VQGSRLNLAARVAGGIVGFASVVAAAVWIASETGEVVVLTTRDAGAKPHQTRLWVVDHDGHTWLRAGGDAQAWYRRLLERPEVEVERGGTTTTWNAVPDPTSRDLINALMLDKYGWADQWIGLVFGRDGAVPIRLDAPQGGG
jgi:hypothetical protein